MRRSVYRLSSLDYFIATANCSGDEDNIFNCSHTLMNSGLTCGYEAGVICQGELIILLYIAIFISSCYNIIIQEVSWLCSLTPFTPA